MSSAKQMANAKQKKAQELNWGKFQLLSTIHQLHSIIYKLEEHSPGTKTVQTYLMSARARLETALTTWDREIWKKGGTDA